MTLAQNIEFLRSLPRFGDFSGIARALRPEGAGRLTETLDFGDNPGDLRMFSFAPGDQRARRKSPLVVVLHGCTQTAADYDAGAGWSVLAERHGFALLMPQQKTSNNPNGCFNWFNPEDTARGRGEAGSIRQMIERMVRDHALDSDRVFVTGLSAGGAMTSVLLAVYPEVFAAGAIIAGLPFGVASTVKDALGAMMQPAVRPAAELGDLVRYASAHAGPWPRVSIWHGSADRTVDPANAGEIAKQWLDLHRLPTAAMSRSSIDGQMRQIWWNAAGETVVESFTVAGMGHGVPLGVGTGDALLGSAGAFMLEAGISSSRHIADFFGLTGYRDQPAEPVTPTGVPVAAFQPMPDLQTTLWPQAVPVKDVDMSRFKENSPRTGAVAARLLKAMGLRSEK